VSDASTSLVPALKRRMSVCQLATPLLRSATPGTTHFVLPASVRATGVTSSGSLVSLSSTEAYAVTLPLPPTTEISTRPSLSEPTPCVREERVELRVLAARELDRELVQLLAVAAEDFDEQRGGVAGTFDDAEVRAVAIGLRDLLEREDGGGDSSVAPPTKFANGTAGMYWPNVPFAVMLKCATRRT
jgi:hypothetical protein